MSKHALVVHIICSIKIRSCVFLSNCWPGAETASWQLEKCWAKLNSSELIPDFVCVARLQSALRLQPEFSQLMGEWYRQDKDLIQKSGCRANILLKSKWKMRGMEEDLDFCHARWEMTEMKQKTFSHPTTQPALRCSAQGWLFNSTKNQRRLVCWTSMISRKKWKVMIRDAVSCTFALFVHFHNAVCFSISMYSTEHQMHIGQVKFPTEEQLRETMNMKAAGLSICDHCHDPPWSMAQALRMMPPKKYETTRHVLHGFVTHLDTSRIRNGSSSVPDWSICLLRSEEFLAGQSWWNPVFTYPQLAPRRWIWSRSDVAWWKPVTVKWSYCALALRLDRNFADSTDSFFGMCSKTWSELKWHRLVTTEYDLQAHSLRSVQLVFLLQFAKALTFRLALSSENNISKLISLRSVLWFCFQMCRSIVPCTWYRHSSCFMLYIVLHTDSIGRCPWIVVDFSNWGNNVVFMTCWCPRCAPWRLQQKRPGDPEFMAVLEASSCFSLVPFHFGIQATFANVQVMFICSYVHTFPSSHHDSLFSSIRIFSLCPTSSVSLSGGQDTAT